MEVYYNSMGVPFIIKDRVVYEMLYPNVRDLIAELALDVDLFYSIKNNIISSIKSLGEKIVNIDPNDNVVSISNNIEKAFYLAQFNSVLTALGEAEDIQHQIINPQPYNSWSWDRLNKTWTPPVERPEGILDEDAVWDENSMSWQPTILPPYDQWIWSWQTKTWEAPIAYPVGAEENEFIWSNEIGTWVLNDQAS
jgi:hypothetical protein